MANSRFRKSGMFCMAFLLAGGLLIGGCGSHPNQMEGNRYHEDGYMGLTHTNPNFHMNPAHYTYQKDRQLMMQSLRKLGLDKRAAIWMNGAHVTVTIEMDSLDEAETEALKMEVYEQLKGNVPRYDYTVKIR
jgi:hypothetical protein